LLIALTVLSACQPQTVVVEKEVEKVVTQVVKETVKETVVVEGTPKVVEKEVTKVVERQVEKVVTPTSAPVDRTGSWLDMVVVVEETSAESAVVRLDVGEIDVYAYAVAKPEVFQTVQGMPNLGYAQFVGGNDDITFNVAGPIFEGTGKLNPFAVAKIREAMNWLIDREYIGQDIMGGLGKPRYLPLVGGFPDYARYIDKVRELEAYYGYDRDRAAEVITQEMEALGAQLVDGVWQYEGEPVELTFLIRTEDERRDIGDYVATQLEELGFTVQRDYRKSAEASPLWLQGNPEDGLWNLYTGGWIVTTIDRDQADMFDGYFTPRGWSVPLWQAYSPSPEFDEVADRLNRNDFQTMEERRDLFSEALELAMQDSSRIWLVDELSFSPYRRDVIVAADLAGGIAGSWLWPFTLRREGEVGGAMTFANAGILTNPWNPIAGTNWIYDMTLIRGTGDRETMPDPFTGLTWPQRVERAEVYVKEGLPAAKTLDWVDLEFLPEVQVPQDAWIDWDAEEQRFVTVGEKHPEGLTANSKVVVRYPSELYDIKWHDGSSFSLADIVMSWILTFDLAKEESAVYDESQVPDLTSWQTHLKGYRIVQEDPLIIEYYSDQYFMDSELNLSLSLDQPVWFPYYEHGQGAWHNLAVGLLAEANQELAFSADKSDALEVEWTNYIAGPSIEILEGYLGQASDENYVPYATTLGQFITADEAQARWYNLQEWYRTKGHFWIGTGAFYLERAFPVEGTVILKRNLDYPDPADKWARFGAPMFAEVEIDGPGRVAIGSEAAYDVYLTFGDQPYLVDDIDEVKYLVFDATGELALSGAAEAVEDGLWKIVLDKDGTSELEAGSNRLEVAVVSKRVSIPTFESLEFVTAP
jgi:peptide/nickel transport system substrate-binding protein